MPIKSYLAYPTDGKRSELSRVLGNIPGCEVIPSQNQYLLILVTDTPNQESEEELEQLLQSVNELKFLALVSGYEEDPMPETTGVST